MTELGNRWQICFTGAAGVGAGGTGEGATGDPRAGGTGAVGAGDPGAGDTRARGAGTGGAGAFGAGYGDTGRPRPYFVPLLKEVLGLLSSTGLTPPFLCPPPDQSQPLLQPASPFPAPSPYTEQTGGLTERCEPVSRPASLVCAVRTGPRVPRQRPPPVPGTHHMALRLSFVPQRVPRPSPPASSLAYGPDLEPDFVRAASPTLPRLLATVVTNPLFESTAVSALVAELIDFASACRLDYATALLAESESASPPSVGGSPPVFKARYVARGFNQRQGVDYFQTFSPTSKMTTLRVLLHVAAQRDYELHSLDFNTAFLQGSLHEEIWLRRPPGFTGSFPAGTQWSLRRPVYGLRQAPREWHDTLRTTLAALGFAPSTADPSLFLRTDTSLPQFYVLVYVDEMVFATADTETLALVKSELQKMLCDAIICIHCGVHLSAPSCWKRICSKLAMGEENMLEEGDARDRWTEKSAVLYNLILQSVNNDMFQHIKDLVELDDSGPNSRKLLRDVIQPNMLPMVIVLEKELAALSMRLGDDVKPVLDKIKDTYARMSAAGSNVSQMQQCTKITLVLDNSWDNLIPPSTLSRTSGHLSGYGSRFCKRTFAGATRMVVLPTKLLRGMELQEAAEEEGEGEAEAVGEALAEGEAKVTTMRGMGALVAGGAPEWRVRVGSGAKGDGAQGKANLGMFCMVEDVKESEGDVGTVGKVVMHPLTHWVIDSGCTSHMTPRADLLDEVKPPRKIKVVAAASGALLPVIGVGNAKVMGANGGLMGLGNVLLVEGLSANLLFVHRLQKSKAKVLQRFGFRYSSPQSTPLPTGHSLSAPPSDESVEPSGPYPELVGCLMYLMTCTRLYLAYPLSILERDVAPGRQRPEHWEAAKRVLHYLCSTLGMGLVLGGRGPVVLTGHANASWVDDLAT
ncbi:unnamed protein product [Closterium sp. NIES-54]